MSDKVREYRGQNIVITFDAKRCIHARECVRGLPAVFDTSRRPWVDPDGAEADQAAAVVMRCPTGALHFERSDGGAAEPLPDQNSVVVSANGPLYLRGDIEISTSEGTILLEDTRVALCRCGVSQNKPFCDGSHAQAGFVDAGALAENRLKAGQETTVAGKLKVTLAPNGPVLLEGPVELQSDDGMVRYNGQRGALCRCGGSQTRPFCDGTHTRIGFVAE